MKLLSAIDSWIAAAIAVSVAGNIVMLAIALRGSKAEERPAIIRALAEFRWWRW